MTIVLCFVFYWMILIPFFKRHLIWVCHQWLTMFFFLVKVIWGIRYQIKGLDNLPQTGAFIIASKHQSLLETFILFRHIPQFSFILKRELLWIPLWGWWFARLGRTIAIDRKSGVKALQKMLLVAEKFKKMGRAIIIYPEGTRTLPGQRMPLKGGVGVIYQKLKIDIVPVALNSGCFFPKKGVYKSGIVTIQFLPPIKSGLPKKEMMVVLENILHQESMKLVPSEKSSEK